MTTKPEVKNCVSSHLCRVSCTDYEIIADPLDPLSPSKFNPGDSSNLKLLHLSPLSRAFSDSTKACWPVLCFLRSLSIKLPEPKCLSWVCFCGEHNPRQILSCVPVTLPISNISQVVKAAYDFQKWIDVSLIFLIAFGETYFYYTQIKCLPFFVYTLFIPSKGPG